jgi:hypothetical protein
MRFEEVMAVDDQPSNAPSPSATAEAATVAVQFTLPKWAVDEARLDEATLDETAREVLALDLFRRGLLTRPDLGRMFGLDRFETGAHLKRQQLFDDPTHEELDAEVEATRALLDRARR